MLQLPPISTLFPYTTLFRSRVRNSFRIHAERDSTFPFGDVDERVPYFHRRRRRERSNRDRKSTRLNSSHPSISYAVFCLKKKKNKQTLPHALTISQRITHTE